MPNVTNATPVPPSTVDYNSDVTYTCQDGYSHTAGDLTRTCKADGSLKGSSPVCTSKLQWQCWHGDLYVSSCKLFKKQVSWCLVILEAKYKLTSIVKIYYP